MICAGLRQIKWAKKSHVNTKPFWGHCVFAQRGAKSSNFCSNTIVSAQRKKVARLRVANTNIYLEQSIQQQTEQPADKTKPQEQNKSRKNKPQESKTKPNKERTKQNKTRRTNIQRPQTKGTNPEKKQTKQKQRRTKTRQTKNRQARTKQTDRQTEQTTPDETRRTRHALALSFSRISEQLLHVVHSLLQR